jgi:putative glutamine amidotransferase
VQSATEGSCYHGKRGAWWIATDYRTKRKEYRLELHERSNGRIVVVGQWREGQGGRIPVAYLDALRSAGGNPRIYSTFELGPGDVVPDDVIATMGLDEDDLSPMDRAVGLLLPGGGDIDPEWYGRPRHSRTHNVNNRRDRFERNLLNEALRRDMPVLAICHGMQLLNVCLGGTLHQNLADSPQRIKHDNGYPSSQSAHQLRLKERSVLARILGGSHFQVNSHHHQGLDEVAGPLEEVGWAEDGVLEAVESPAHSCVIGVQWHPEVMAPVSEEQRRLFAAFVDACEAFDSARRVKATA